MAMIDAESNRGWDIMPVAKAALSVIELPDGTPLSHVGKPGSGKA
jgi:hypothetical protein